jgi:predicted permease
VLARFWDRLRLDLRYAARSLGRNPGFAAVAVLCLALGIGANTTMFGVVDTLMFRPPRDVRDPGRVVRVYFGSHAFGGGGGLSGTTNFPNFADIASSYGASYDVAAYYTTQTTLGRGPEAQQVTASLVTSSFFSLLGVRPAIGRFFSADEDRQAGAPVAVLGYGLWRRLFGGKVSALGRTLWIGRDFCTVVGVAPAGFGGAELGAEVWLPIRRSAEALLGAGALTSRGAYWVNVLARLKPHVSRERAAAIATLALRRGNAADQHGDTTLTASLYPVLRDRGPQASEGARVAVWATLAAAVVLLIACANVAGLLLARSEARLREIAVRRALGASRARLASHLLMETLLLAAAGSAAGVLVALWGGAAARTYLLPQASAAAAVLSWRVVAFTAAVAICAALVCGVLPALAGSAIDPGGALRSAGIGRSSPRGQSSLVVAQVALSLVLFFGTALLSLSIRNMEARAGGLDVERLLIVSTDAEAAGYARADARVLYEHMRDRIMMVPHVTGASIASNMPLTSAGAISIEIPGGREEPTDSSGERLVPYVYPVGAEWFATAATRIVAGRGFTDADRFGTPLVAVVNATMARAYWPGQSAIGKCLLVGAGIPSLKGKSPGCTQVVGVAEDVVRIGLRERQDAQYYVPLEQLIGSWFPPRYVLVHAGGDPADLIAPIRKALQDIAPDLPYVNVQPLTDLYGWRQLRPLRMGTAMFSAFAVLGLVLAAVGLYGLLSFVVAKRTSEMAVRIALGAETGSIRWLMVRRGLKLGLLGVAIGVPGAIGVGHELASLLYGVSAFNPALLGVAAGVLLAVAAAASYIPARRATRVDPALALRAE